MKKKIFLAFFAVTLLLTVGQFLGNPTATRAQSTLPVTSGNPIVDGNAQKSTATTNSGSACKSTPWLTNILPGGTIIPCDCTGDTPSKCDLNDVLQTVVNIATLITAVTGSAALLMFVYGGVMMIISAGSPDRVSKSKAILQAAVIGIAIIFGAWTAVNFLVITLTGGKAGNTAVFFKGVTPEPGESGTPETNFGEVPSTE